VPFRTGHLTALICGQCEQSQSSLRQGDSSGINGV